MLSRMRHGVRDRVKEHKSAVVVVAEDKVAAEVKAAADQAVEDEEAIRLAEAEEEHKEEVDNESDRKKVFSAWRDLDRGFLDHGGHGAGLGRHREDFAIPI